MTIDLNTFDQTTLTENPPAYIRQAPTYDPGTNTLIDSRKLSVMEIFTGDSDSYTISIEDQVKHIITAIKKEDIENCVIRVAGAQGTAIPASKPLWPFLPTIADYLDINSLYDSEETDKAFIGATKKLGW